MHPQVSRDTIDFVIRDVARANGMDAHVPALIAQCEAESSHRVDAHNKGSDCYGLFQLSDTTAMQVGVNRYDWRDNIVGGVKYMAWLLKFFQGDYRKALAGFNWGLGNVRKCVAAHGEADWVNHLPTETAHYLGKIL
jgi:membrane-bound lytic murein transglycosylase MltF